MYLSPCIHISLTSTHLFITTPSTQHSWTLSKLSTQESGEIPPLHIYEIYPIQEKTNKDTPADDEEISLEEPPKYSYLALSQRKLNFVPGPFLHPFQPCVFGSPLLLRIRDLDGFTGEDLYAHIARKMHRFVPNAPLKNNQSSSSGSAGGGESTLDDSVAVSPKTRRGRQYRQKTLAENVCDEEVPPYGFRLRLVSRDGSRCALCNWYSCCVGFRQV